jgi:GTP-binding protein
VYDVEMGLLLGDLKGAGDRLVVARGGRGGKGNSHFTSSRLRSPRFAQPGEAGQQRRLRLELAVLADVGFLGLPNAGKTTLLIRLTASKAQPGAYPFSTLEPNLGVLADEEHEPLVLADIPGLIGGAHQGKGLGHQFLRHVKRTRMLLHVLDVSEVDPEDPEAFLRLLEDEIRAFDPNVLAKPRVIVLNKIDLLPPDFPLDRLMAHFRQSGYPCVAVSAHTGEGLTDLIETLWREAAPGGQPADKDGPSSETTDYYPG